MLAGRDVAVIADADKGGRDAAQGIAHKLHSLGCTVQVALPDGDTGEDVADWIAADGPEATAARIAALLQPYEPPPEPEETAGAPAVEIGDAGRGWADTNQFLSRCSELMSTEIWQSGSRAARCFVSTGRA